jgi:hypothetical protein
MLVLSFCKDNDFYANGMHETGKTCNKVAEKQHLRTIATKLQQCFPTFAA